MLRLLMPRTPPVACTSPGSYNMPVAWNTTTVTSAAISPPPSFDLCHGGEERCASCRGIPRPFPTLLKLFLKSVLSMRLKRPVNDAQRLFLFSSRLQRLLSAANIVRGGGHKNRNAQDRALPHCSFYTFQKTSLRSYLSTGRHRTPRSNLLL